VAVKIKLKRMGKIHAPFYRIIVADARTKRDGRAIEEIGKYHPMNEPSFIEVNSERAQHWLSVGAQPTDPVRKILEITGDWQKFKGLPGAEGTLKTAAPRADKKDAYAAAVAEVHGVGDTAKGKGRKPAGKGDGDQAGGEAKPAKAAGRAGGKQAAAKPGGKPDAAKADAPKADTAKADAPKADAPKADAPKADVPKADAAKADAPDAAKADAPEVAAADTAAQPSGAAQGDKAETSAAAEPGDGA
jgi:small subunit ribosomal protein S16